MRPESVNQIYRSTRRIQGWLPQPAAQLCGLINEVQQSRDVVGDLFEIGVWHGKSAVLLSHMTKPGESLHICDISQKHLDITESNVLKLGPGDTQVVSHAVPVSEIEAGRAPDNVRFMHIDGGHGEDDVLADLRFALRCLGEHGVIMMDDAFLPSWPGVSSAIASFLIKEAPGELVPLFTGFKKLVLVRPQSLALYETPFTDPAQHAGRFDRRLYHPREEKIFGQDVLLYTLGQPTNDSMIGELGCVVFRHHPWIRNRLTRGLYHLAGKIRP